MFLPDDDALLVELGFDVNALGRSDAPIEQPWETALHVLASNGDFDLARQLLAISSNPRWSVSSHRSWRRGDE